MSEQVSVLGVGVDSSGVRSGTRDIDSFTKASKGAEKAATDYERAMTKAVVVGDLIGRSIANVAAQAWGLTKAFVGLGVSIGKYQDLADRTNADPAGLASMQAAADVAGISLETVATHMNMLTQRMMSGEHGSKRVAAALKALGINAKEFANLKTDEQYRLVAKQMFEYAHAADRVAIAQALLGRGGAAELVMMKELNSEKQRNNIVTNEMIRRADDLADTVTRQTSETRQLLAVLSADGLLGALSDLNGMVRNVVGGMVGLNQETGAFDAKPLQEFADDVANALAFAADAAVGFVSAVKLAKEAAKFVGWKALLGPVGIAGSFMFGDEREKAALGDLLDKEAAKSTMFRDALAKSRQQRAVKSAEAARDLLRGGEWGLNNPDGAKTGGKRFKDALMDESGKVKKVKDDFMDAYDDMIAAREKYMDGLRDEVAMFGMSTTDATKYKLALTDLSEEQRKQALIMVEALDIKRKDAEIEKERKRVIEDVMTPLERYTAELERYERLMLDSETLSRARKKAFDEYAKQLTYAKEKVSELDEFTKQAASNIQDILGDSIEAALSGNFDNIGRSWGRMLKGMVAQVMAQRAALTLFGDFGKTGEIGGWVGSALKMIGSLAGGYGTPDLTFESPPSAFPGGVTPFADGGRPPMNRLSLVGEKGPELFVPDTSGTIVSNKRLGGFTYAPSINVKVDSRADAAQVAANVNSALAANNRMLLQYLRARGVA